MSNAIPLIAAIEAPAKINLLGLTRGAMIDFFQSLGEKAFRAEQMMKWIHHWGMADFEKMTNLSKALRTKLSEIAEIQAPEVAYKHYSQDGTRKWVLKLDERNSIETVFIPSAGRGTLCVSSQVGCSLDCQFCSTGKQGFQRDLTASEIIGQIWVANQSFGPTADVNKRSVTNIVMMGMGEPLLNFDPVVASMELMLDDFGYGLSKRRVTLSTSGVVPALRQLTKTVDVALAISLHAPNDALRNELVPINKKYPLKELLAACREYIDAYDHKRKITMEYVMLRQVNDQDEHAHQLIKLLRDLPVKINLIPFNPFPRTQYQRSTDDRIRQFQTILINAGYTTTIRTTRGDDIDAACGQLVGQVQDRTRRSQTWKAQNNQSDLG